MGQYFADYTTESNKCYWLLLDDDQDVDEGIEVNPFNSPVIYVKEHPKSNKATFSIIPYGKNAYFIKGSTLVNDETFMSKIFYTYDEAIEIIAKIRDLSFDKAKFFFEHKGY